MYAAKFSARPWRVRASRYSGNDSKSHGMPAERHAASMSSTFSNVRMMRSRSALRAGASENPQLPATTVVTPWRQDDVSAGSQNTWAS